MKTLRRLLLAMVVLAASAAMVWAQNAHKSAIIGSAHDLTTYYWAGATTPNVTTNLCFFCHITHKTGAGTITTAPGYLLWNHTLSGVTGGSTGTYGVYSSDTFNALLQASSGAITDLSASNNVNTPTVSNLCLSCHDGTVAIASFYQTGFNLPANGSTWGNTHGTSTDMYSGFELQDLTRSHPVNFNYTTAMAAAAGGGLLAPATPTSVDGYGGVPLYGGNSLMECTTCHDPHNGTFVTVAKTGTTTGATTTVFPFPRLTLANQAAGGQSAICTYCHT